VDGAPANLRLVPAEPAHAATVAGWSRTPAETRQWCSRGDHPLAADVVTGWWEAGDVQPWLLVSAAGRPVAYGELWLDPDEDEVELARIIVAPEARGRGIGHRMVDELTVRAAGTGLRQLFLRVDPENTVAIGCYRAAGFVDVHPELSAQWNREQPVDYLWLCRPGNR
jgi:[ribosomal protein S18]-alanine N-acetyltransferase